MEGTVRLMSEVLDHHPMARKYWTEPADFLNVCTTCFGLTSHGQNYQHCDCEPTPKMAKPSVDCPSGFNLCYLCARDIAGGITRWSWLVCKTCVEVARGRKVKGKPLPLGRHSTMNGYSWSVGSGVDLEVDSVLDSLVDQIASDLTGIFEASSYLISFGGEQAKKLFLSEPALLGLASISMDDWRKHFPTSRECSLRAVSDFRRWAKSTSNITKNNRKLVKEVTVGEES